jgi:hypothetical protein
VDFEVFAGGGAAAAAGSDFAAGSALRLARRFTTVGAMRFSSTFSVDCFDS